MNKNSNIIKLKSNQKEIEEEKLKSELRFFSNFIENFKNKLKLFGNSENQRKSKSKTWKSKRTNRDHYNENDHYQFPRKPILIKPNQINNKTTSTITKPVTPINKPVTPIAKPITKPVTPIAKPSDPKSNQQTPFTANPKAKVKLTANPKAKVKLTANPTITLDLSDSDSRNQRCQGTTREGKGCSRKPMKSNLTYQSLNRLESLLDSNHQTVENQISSITLPKFCFQHFKLNLNQLGTFLLNGKWIQFNHWISDELTNQTKLILRNEMIKPITNQDKEQKGYLYCHEMIPDRSTPQSYPTTTLIKVGRSIQPIRRLSQWKTQCPSKQPIIRDVFPLLNESGFNSYQLGYEKLSEIGIKFHHRWERLCLIELNAWSDLQSIQRNRLSNNNQNNHQNTKCQDCGKLHLELFVFDSGSYERFIKKLILKWQKWCEYAYE